MKKGDRVSYQGRAGTVEGSMPGDMIDVRFDDASHRVERRNRSLLARANPVACMNPDPWGRRPRRSRRERRSRGQRNHRVAYHNPDEDVIQWRGQMLAEAREGLRKAELHRKSPLWPGWDRLHGFIQMLEEASLEDLAARMEATMLAPRPGRRHEEEELVFDESTGEWSPKDWTKIRDPVKRRQKKEEAEQEMVDRHLAYLRNERAPGGDLSPLTADEQSELRWLMQRVTPPDVSLPDAEPGVPDLARASLWVTKLEELQKDLAKEAHGPGYTAEEGYRPGEGADRHLLQELQTEWSRTKKPEADAVVRLFSVDKKISEKELKDELMKQVSQGKLLPAEAKARHEQAVQADRQQKKKVADEKERAAKEEARTPAERDRDKKEKEKKRKEVKGEKAAREAARLKDAGTALTRSATFRPKTQRELNEGIAERIGRNKAGFFTRPDPPRLSNDRRVYCGNPIDRTAYYLVVDNNKKWVPRFITWKEVEKRASEGEEPLPPNDTIGPFALRYNRHLGGLVKEAAIPRISTYGYKGVERLAQLQSTIKEKEGEYGLYAVSGAPADMIEAHKLKGRLEKLRKAATKEGKRVEDLIQLFVSKAEVHVRFAAPPKRGKAQKLNVALGQDRYKQVTNPDQVIPAGSLVQIVLPSKDRLDALAKVFSAYRDSMEHRPGVTIFTVEPKFRKYIKSRKSKHRSAQSSQPRAEDIGKQPKAEPAGTEPPANAYAQIDSGGQLTYFRLSKWDAPGPNLLKKFRPYVFRSLSAAHEGTLRDALVAGLGASSQVADWLVRSGAVAASVRGKSVVMLDPTADVAGPSWDPDKQTSVPGTRITVWLKDKADSPFFSWVPTVVPFKPRDSDKGQYAVCLSAEEKKAQSELKVLKRQVQQLAGALGGVRSLFQKLARDPSSLKGEREDLNPRRVFSREAQDWVKETRPSYYSDVRRILSRLANAYAGLFRWYLNFSSNVANQEPAALLVQTILRDAARPVSAGGADFRLSDLNEYWESFTTGAGIEQGLIGRGGAESDLLDGHRYDAFITAYRDSIVGTKAGSTQVKVTKKKKGKKAQTLGQMQAKQAQQIQARGPWTPENGPQSRTLIEPAILWLEGSVTCGHPADDLLAFSWDSLSDEATVRIHKARSEAIKGDGVSELLTSDGPPDPKSAMNYADYVMWAAKNYAQGGVRMRVPPQQGAKDIWTKKGVIFGDPLYPKKKAETKQIQGLPYAEFDLIPALGFEMGIDKQLDTNWAIGLVLDDIYPALKQRTEVDDIRQETKELLLLAVIYSQLGGYKFAGPLDPMHPCYNPTSAAARRLGMQSKRGGLSARQRKKESAASPCSDLHALRRLGSFLNKAEAEMLGGSVNISRTGNYTAYMTYNPILFEITRLFWPGHKSDPGFRSLLDQSAMMQDIDAVGRYGSAATDAQKAAVSSTSTEQVFEKLRAMLAPGAGREPNAANASLVLRGPKRKRGQAPEPSEGPEEYDIKGAGGVVRKQIIVGQDPLGQPIGHYTPFALLWPLGDTMAHAIDSAVQFATNPINYLDHLKTSAVDPALSRVLHFRSSGLPRPPSPLGRKKGPGSHVLREVRRGKRTLDPREPEGRSAHARAMLRSALIEAAPPGSRSELTPDTEKELRQKLRFRGVDSDTVDQIITQRRVTEAEALERFQSKPGNVLRRRVQRTEKKDGPVQHFARWQAEALRKKGEPKEWWGRKRLADGPDGTEMWTPGPQPPVFQPPLKYDAATLRMLEEVQSSPRRPPATLPPVFDDRYYGKKETGAGKEQAARWQGQDAIYSRSALARAEGEREALAAMLESVEEAMQNLDGKIAAGEKKKGPKKAKKNQRSRRPRRSSHRRRR
jgi:hypothetical protein